MKLSDSFLVSAFIGAASAIADANANVYIFDANGPLTTTSPPILTPEEARLIFAQRLGVSPYHAIGDVSETTLSYINKFGASPKSLFQGSEDDKAAELILIVEGFPSEAEEPLVSEWASLQPAFTILKPPSMSANERLVLDLQRQCGQGGKKCLLENAINPYDKECWNGKSSIIHFDLVSEKVSCQGLELMSAQKRLVRFTEKKEINFVVVLMPEASRTSKSSAKPYGSYEAPSQGLLGKVRRQAMEEPIAEARVPSAPPPALSLKEVQFSNSSSNSTLSPLPKLPALCYASEEVCASATNNCSGHGSCYKKYSTTKSACFTCGCRSTNETFTHAEKQYYTTVAWGGSACHKRDVSSPFWLIAIFTVVLVGIVSWGIGLMYSIGEEKLPGVIGAGVSSKTR
ncbi:hypothetical protein QTJ16_003426 [Diplocarpon rosae]|uniref:DUF3844 domain-containing protein n=1 Tax=Diplocarpon rosae TaxID=946125 RepID=A0AAD9T164_9HELO|nr:hypothetical protein QTJ16_003426 [Diplocarpon rosae]